MNYKEALSALNHISNSGIIPGLATISNLLQELGNPQNHLNIIHIAGTNGKGSIGAMLAAMLAAAGYKTGRFFSPAVFNRRETIQILEQKKEGIICSFISKKAVSAHAKMIIKAIGRIKEAGKETPTAFEIETAMAFLELSMQDCDIAVIECGMGGRLDATNVAEHVVCSVIAPIAMDHMAFLGDTLKDIAKEKAGIIKLGVPVVSAPQKETVKEILQHTAAKKQAELMFIHMEQAQNILYNLNGIDFIYTGWNDCKNTPIHLSLLAPCQVQNALTALMAIQVLNHQKYFHISLEQAQYGLSQTKWHGRFDILGREPLFVADGAHNPAAAAALRDFIQYCLPEFVDNSKNKQTAFGKLIFIMGMFKDKDIDGVIEKTADLAEQIFTVMPDSTRGLSDQELADRVKKYIQKLNKHTPVIPCGNVKQGIKQAYAFAKKEDTIIMFGSLSLLKDYKDTYENDIIP